MVRKSLILRIFDAAYMQRWNDKLRPIELIELDKQAHKMFIAYFLGKFEESHPEFNWVEIIENAIFGLLERIVITDIKPPIFYKIKQDKEKYKQLNEFVFDKLKSVISPLGDTFVDKFRRHLSNSSSNINTRVINAAHMYASSWEFNLLESLNREDDDIAEIKASFQKEIESYYDLEGMEQLHLHGSYKNFINLCGKLRFQARWAHLHRIPRTSVLGHSLFVAILSYLFSLEVDACPKRSFNNFFCGLFHDLPEVLTRDIISPIKSSIEGLDDLVKSIETQYAEERLYPLIPPNMIDEIKSLMQNEFANFVTVENKRIKVSRIYKKYNKDEFSPKDGCLVKAADDLGAFVEASSALQNGCMSYDFQAAINSIKIQYERKSPIVSGINFAELYADF